jgi:sugar/nucleoside kinase (ribokinase family)
LPLIYEASQRTEILTPNHEEVASMQGLDFKKLLSEHDNDFKKTIEYCGNRFLDGIKSTSSSNIKILVVRASKYGTMMIEPVSRSIHWVPAYWSWWSKEDQEHVIDVTGAGNAFCGGYAYGWIKTNGDAVESTYFGSISASFIVEQIGVPALSDGNQSWNVGPSPKERLAILKSKSCKF